METRNLIDGTWRGIRDGRSIQVSDPATDELIAEIPSTTHEEVQAAIDAAAAAFPNWRNQTANERGRIIRRFADLVYDRREELAVLISREGGKPIGEARGEVTYGHSFLAWAAEEATRVYGETIPAWHPDKRIIVSHQPVGVTAAITPWNFPLAMITRKLGPALAAGCTQVVKPASQTPLTAIELGRLAQEAGVPAGVVNVVTGSGALVASTVFADPRVRKVSFTGSTEVGQELIRLSAENVTRLSLELGGHAPTIVYDDVDLDVAVAGVIRAKFRNNGQSCIASNRIYVQDGILDDFVEAYGDAVAGLQLGATSEDASDIGPLIDDDAVAKVQEHVDDALRRGAKLVQGGKIRDLGPKFSKRFYEPTLVTSATDDMLVFTEETFGPLAAVTNFKDETEAIYRANQSPFGLAAYVFSRDVGRIIRTVEGLDYGVIGVNDGAPSSGQTPFGGMKMSGYGREGGKYVMESYLETKYIALTLPPAH